jgi:peptidoglycan/LPS O-acetylase OafA/YrhL
MNHTANHLHWIRLGLASLVIFSHAPELIDGNRTREILTLIFGTYSFGEFAVNLFFVLSGFLIVQSWIRSPKPVSFFRNRILRIYPAFVVCSLICALCLGPFVGHSDYFLQMEWSKLFLGILFLEQPAIPPIFDGLAYPMINGAMWTIRYEFLCYCLVPVLAWVGFWRWRLFAPILAISCLILSSQPEWLALIPSWRLSDQELWRFIGFFMAGATFTLYANQLPLKWLWAWIALGLAGIGMFYPVLAPLAIAFPLSYFLLTFAFTPIRWLDSLPKNLDLSYGTYLWGWPVMSFWIFWIPDLHPITVALLTLIPCLIFAWLSWNLIEKPALNFKKNHRKDS